jgi:predicted nuclease with TOPRIM domain
MEICLIALVVIIIALVVYFFDKKKRRDEIITMTNRDNYGDNHGLEEWKNWLSQEKEEKKQREIRYQDLNNQLKDWQKRVTELENELTKANDKTPPVIEPTKKLDSYLNLYANAIINGMFFNKVTNQSNDDTVYELTVTSLSDRTAKFTVYKEAYSRVLKNPDFVDGCDKQKLGNQSIEVEAGEAQKQDNDKWKVTKQAKVKFL